MRDSEVVASIVAGDAEGVAEAYDRYADSLFKYCRFLLSDPADAADAVQDTFIIAVARLGDLQDPDRLRAWLYAIARNECLRVLRGRTAPATAEATGGSGDGQDDGRPRLRALIEDAANGLTPAEREVVELHLWHGLDAAEIAAVLGASRPRADWLMSRAMEQFDACLGVLLAGRAEPADCADLAIMLKGWDGNLTPALRWWVHGHVKDCKRCRATRAAELSAAAPAGLSADAAISAAAVESSLAAAGPPAALKEHALALAVGQDPSAVAYRAVLLGRAGAFGRYGFPRPLPRRPAGGTAGRTGPRGAGRRVPGTSRQIRTAAAACVVLVVVGAAVATALTGSSAPVKLAGSGRATAAPAASAASTPARSQAPSATPAHRRPAASHRPRAAASSAPAATGSAGATGPGTGTPPAPPGRGPAPSPPPARPTPPAKPSPPPPPSPPPATLAVQPSGGKLQISPFGTGITLTAQGGSVAWSATVSGGSGHVLVSPSSGTLNAGQRVTVMIWASRHASGRQLTLAPGGTVFTIESSPGGFGANNISPHAVAAVAVVGWAGLADEMAGGILRRGARRGARAARHRPR